MKRKRIAILLSICFIVCSITACGKSKEIKEAEKYYQEELGMDKESAEELAADWYDNEAAAQEAAEKEDAEELEEETEEEIVQFELDPKMEEVDPGAGYVQLDDMVFRMDGTMTLKECLDIVDGSSLASELEYHYNDEKKISPGSHETLDVERDGRVFIEILYYNPEEYDIMDDEANKEHTYMVNDCIVCGVHPMSSWSGEKDFDYWLPGGICLTDSSMSREDLVAQLEAAGYVEAEKEFDLRTPEYVAKSQYAYITEADAFSETKDCWDLRIVYVCGTPVYDKYEYVSAVVGYTEDKVLNNVNTISGGVTATIEQLQVVGALD